MSLHAPVVCSSAPALLIQGWAHTHLIRGALSIRIMSLVWDAPLPPRLMLVALALADMADDDGRSWPAIETLCRKTKQSTRTVEAALREKSAWILRKLQESQQRQHRQVGAQVAWADGVELPYLGEAMVVRLDPAHAFGGRGAALVASTGAGVPHTLQVGLPRNAHAQQIRDAVQAWLMRQAQMYFEARMDYFAPLLQVRWVRLRLSNAGTRWGSASADGNIRLNWRLIHFRAPVIDYVVAHELSHLRVMNHSAQFWDTVASVVPQYQALRAQLRDEAIPRW